MIGLAELVGKKQGGGGGAGREVHGPHHPLQFCKENISLLRYGTSDQDDGAERPGEPSGRGVFPLHRPPLTCGRHVRRCWRAQRGRGSGDCRSRDGSQMG